MDSAHNIQILPPNQMKSHSRNFFTVTVDGGKKGRYLTQTNMHTVYTKYKGIPKNNDVPTTTKQLDHWTAPSKEEQWHGQKWKKIKEVRLHQGNDYGIPLSPGN